MGLLRHGVQNADSVNADNRRVDSDSPGGLGESESAVSAGTVGGQLLPELLQSTTELLVHHSPGTFPL